MTIDCTNFKDKEELYQFIKDNSHSYMRQIKAFNKPLFDEVNQLSGKNFGEKIYKYIHGQGYCWRCKCEVGFVNVMEGYDSRGNIKEVWTDSSNRLGLKDSLKSAIAGMISQSHKKFR